MNPEVSNEAESIIYDALDKLGIKGNITIKPAGLSRYRVWTNDCIVGIYDIDRKTFLD